MSFGSDDHNNNTRWLRVAGSIPTQPEEGWLVPLIPIGPVKSVTNTEDSLTEYLPTPTANQITSQWKRRRRNRMQIILEFQMAQVANAPTCLPATSGWYWQVCCWVDTLSLGLIVCLIQRISNPPSYWSIGQHQVSHHCRQHKTQEYDALGPHHH